MVFRSCLFKFNAHWSDAVDMLIPSRCRRTVSPWHNFCDHAFGLVNEEVKGNGNSKGTPRAQVSITILSSFLLDASGHMSL